jgi:polysaccharide deacetylase family protein (PEP-CTERM system associated)
VQRGISFTLDVEDRPADGFPSRVVESTRAVMGFLQDYGVVGTFFVVGELGRSRPDLVSEIAAAGHEVGLHGLTHRPLASFTPKAFAAECSVGRRVLEDLIGTPVAGFRAPYFSLTRDTSWAASVLAEQGFAYSSSVLPAANPQAGFPGAPTGPFRWAGELIELPVPVVGFGRWSVPILGGSYLRLFPEVVVRFARRRADGRAASWVYAHPYDFDRHERFQRYPGNGLPAALVLFYRRRLMFDRVRLVLGTSPGPPLRVVAASLGEIPRFDPPVA